MSKLQVAQNNVLRTLENKRIRQLLENQNMLSINQTQAQMKILEMWKATNIQIYPLEVLKGVFPSK